MAQVRAETSFGKLPLYFVENQGQMDERVAYYVQGRDKTLYFTPEGVTFALTAPVTSTAAPDTPGNRTPAGKRPGLVKEEPNAMQRWAVKLDFVGANPDLRPAGQEKTDAIISYFNGQPDQWHAGLPTFQQLVYADLWPGIDLVYSGTTGRLKYEFRVRPGADPKQIRLAYSGVTAVSLNAVGQLVVDTPLESFADDTPVAYQDLSTGRGEVPVSYALAKRGGLAARSDDTYEYGFRVGDYDPTRPLVIDPAVLVYAGYIGGAGYDYGNGIAVDGAGNAYVTGLTASSQTTFPSIGGPDLTYNGGDFDAFVVKVDAAGTALVYAGYIGGAGTDEGYGIAVDGVGAAYITGWTSSPQTSFPVMGGPDLTYNGGTYDAFAAKVNAPGTALVYAGYIGGAGIEEGRGIAVDSAGNAYVTGWTSSSQTTFPMTGSLDPTYNGGTNDAFVAKVNAPGTALVYAGYIGGGGEDSGQCIAIDSAGNAYVTGATTSNQITFPVLGGPDLTFNGIGIYGYGDAFVAKVNAPGTALVYAGYIGGAGDDLGMGITVDSAGNAYITGETTSNQTTFPVVGGPDLTFNGIGIYGYGYGDAFVAKVNAPGTALVYAGYIGGAGDDLGMGIAVDSAGNAYVTGWTMSDQTTFPVKDGPDLTFNGPVGYMGDAFVAKVNAPGTGLVYAGYIGGAGDDLGMGITVDSAGNAYVTGSTNSDQTTFPVTIGPDLAYNGGYDAFVAKVRSAAKKPVVVLLHGWLGLTSYQNACTQNGAPNITLYRPGDPNNNFDSDTEHLADWLYQDSNNGATFELWSAHIETGNDHTWSLRDNAICLKNQLAQVASHAPDGKVILIAHSMGGVVARAYIEDGMYNNDVRSLMTLGSPHLGAPSETLVSRLGPLLRLDGPIALGVYCIKQFAVCEFSTTGMLVFNAFHNMRAKGVDYHLISGDAPSESRSAIGRVMGALIPGPDDGIVQTGSGEGSGLGWSISGEGFPIPALSGTLDRRQTDENHNVFGTNSYFNRDTGQSMSYTECIKKLVVDGQTNCGTVSELEVAEQNEPTLAQHTPIETGLLLPGQSATRTIAFEGGPTLFAAQWQTGTLTVTLRAPGGQLLDPAYAAANPAVVSYTTDANAATYYFPNAAAGTWKLTTQSGADIPLAGTAYSTFAAFDSSVALVGNANQPWYAPGATATITAALSGSPASAAIIATVFRADGITDTVTLAGLGGGQYQGAYLVPNAPGYTEVRWRAAGVITDSLPFEREVSGIFQISPNSLALSGNYSEATQRRLPALPLYQALTVTVGVSAAVNGTFGLSADLVDGAGNVVAHSFTVQDLVAGSTTLVLRFPGDDIFAAGRDGPYLLTHLLLTDQRAATLAVAEAQDVYTTTAYRYSDFARPGQVYLPLVRR